MKKIIPVLFIIFLTGCNSQLDNDTKKIELANLQKKLIEIQNQIAVLEKDLANNKNSENNQAFEIPVSIKELQYEMFNHFIEVSGTIEAVNAAFISPEMIGQIKKIYVKEGDYVKKGTILAKLNTSTIEKSIDELKTSLNLATTIYQKQKNLWDQNIGSEIDYLTAKNNKESLEKRLESLNAQLELAYIKAPFDGIIDDLIQKEGELASPGFQMMQLVNLNKLFVNADVSETYLPVVNKGDMVHLSFPIFPELSMDVPIYRIGNIIHTQNRTFVLQLQINNNKEKLKPNGLCIIQINDFSSQKALVVPSIVIKQDMEGSFLYVAKQINNQWISEKRYIKTGVSYKDQSMVIDGLNLGEKVIVEGYNQISDGSGVLIN